MTIERVSTFSADESYNQLNRFVFSAISLMRRPPLQARYAAEMKRWTTEGGSIPVVGEGGGSEAAWKGVGGGAGGRKTRDKYRRFFSFFGGRKS